MSQRLLYSFLFTFVILSCSQKPSDIPGFDELIWQADKDGCDGKRLEMRNDLIKVKTHLKGLNGDEVVSILGKPNKKNLVDRNQKYFIYSISCSDQNSESSTLSIRFNAVGLSYEVIVY